MTVTRRTALQGIAASLTGATAIAGAQANAAPSPLTVIVEEYFTERALMLDGIEKYDEAGFAAMKLYPEPRSCITWPYLGRGTHTKTRDD